MTAGVMGVQAVGGLYSASEQRKSGAATQRYYDALALQSDQEADIALKIGEQRETIAQDQGAYESGVVARNANKVAGQQAVTLAANGITGGVTKEDIARDTFDKKTLDMMAVRYNADTRGWEAKTEAKYKAWDAKNRSSQYKMSGVNARKAGNAAGVATLFNTASQVLGTSLSYSLRGGSLEAYNPAAIK
jgi:hypothetical protein